MAEDFLAFAHIGDLHMASAEAENARDYRAILHALDGLEGLDFLFLPGDNADHGLPAEYALVRAGLDTLRLPVHAITGDHDMAGGSLDAFYKGLRVPALPYARDIGGVRCLFLDMCGPGKGGPDFRLGETQLSWLRYELSALAQARDGGDGGGDVDGGAGTARHGAVFMHSYPADLRDCAQEVASLLHHAPVRLVEMGHTHYNELANDGRTIYAACRSTGQIEEGPVGFAVAALDGGVVSWRFKPLARPWPFVLVTAPADRRLRIADGGAADGMVRALVLGPAPIARCAMRVDGGAWQDMQQGRRRRFSATLPAGATEIAVRAWDSEGNEDEDIISVSGDNTPVSKNPGSDADSVGAWPEKGILGTQLGPNRNGRQW